MKHIWPSFCTITVCLFVLFSCFSNGMAMGNKVPLQKAGYYAVNTWDTLLKERIIVHIWYPSISRESTVNLTPYVLKVARKGSVAEGTYPLVVLSHATAESGLTHHNTAASLARSGYVVAAPTHPGDNLQDTRRTLSPYQIAERLREIPSILSTVLKEKKVGPLIDHSRIAMLGYGAGATTALLMAGATPNPTPIAEYCATRSNIYCSRWAQRRLGDLENILAPPILAMDEAPQKVWRDDRIKAFVAISPGFSMLFGPQSFQSIFRPLFFVEAGKNALYDIDEYRAPMQEAPPSKLRYSLFDQANEYSFQAPCSRQKQRLYKSLCSKENKGIKQEVHSRLLHELKDFFTTAFSASETPKELL